MADVTLSVGGHQYKVACRDGEEPHLHRLAAFVDGKVREARSAVGELGEVRQLLLAALLLADEQLDAKAVAAVPDAQTGSDDELTGMIETIADRIEAIATTLEKAR